MFSMAAELALGFLVGLFAKLRTDEDYAAWCKLKEIHELIVKLEERVAELFARIEIAKKQCTAGIRRARSIKEQAAYSLSQSAGGARVLRAPSRSHVAFANRPTAGGHSYRREQFNLKGWQGKRFVSRVSALDKETPRHRAA